MRGGRIPGSSSRHCTRGSQRKERSPKPGSKVMLQGQPCLRPRPRNRCRAGGDTFDTEEAHVAKADHAQDGFQVRRQEVRLP